MSSFTKTLIVDSSLQPPLPQGTYTNIASAATALTPNGGTIIVEAGTYNIGLNDTIAVPSNTTIIGRGNVVVNVNNNVPAFSQEGSVGRIILTGFKIVVTLSSNSYTSQVINMRNVTNCIFEKLYITTTNPQNEASGDGNNAIYIHNAKNCRVTQCTIKGETQNKGFRNGIYLFYGSDHKIKLNYVRGCQTNLGATHSERGIVQSNIFFGAIGIVGGSNYALNISLGECKDFVIRGNQLNATDPATGAHGLYPSGCEELVIAGNIVCNNRGNGIKPRYADTNVADKFYSIIGNICNDNGLSDDGNGIHLQGYAQRMSIYGNVCNNNKNNGIRLQKESNTVKATNNLVVGNVAVLNHDNPGYPNNKAIANDDDTSGNVISHNIEENFT